MTDTSIEDRFNRAMNRLDLPPQTAVAVSGGADSMALMLLTAAWAERCGHPLPLAVTVDHGLRAAAAEEAKRVGAWAAALGLEHTVLAWQGPKPDANIQSTARLARYRLLGDFCCEHGASALLTAHTEDDQAETLLLRLARGSGVDGLGGIPEDAPLPLGLDGNPDIRLIRPLLDFSANELRRYLKQRDQDWIEDPSNNDLRYARVRMRNALVQLADLGITAPGLAKTARRMQRASRALTAHAAELLQHSTRIYNEGYADIDTAPLAAAPRETALRALAGLLVALGGGTYRPRFNRLERLFDALTNPADCEPDLRQNGYTLAGCRILPLDADGTSWRISRERGRRTGERVPLRPAVSGRPRLEAVWDRRFRVTLGGPDAALAALVPVELGCLGHPPPAAVKAAVEASADRDRRWREIPAPVRPTLPALWTGDTLVAVPHLTPALLAGEKKIAAPMDKIRIEATFLGLSLSDPAPRQTNYRPKSRK